MENFNQQGLLQILFDTTMEGVLVVDKLGEIAMANPRITELFGYKKDELLGQTVEMLIPEIYHKSHAKHRDQYQRRNAKRYMGGGMNLLAKHADGTIFQVKIRLNHFKQGDDGYSMALISDITKHRSTQELNDINVELEKRIDNRTYELRQSQELYQAIASNFPRGRIAVLDNDLRYIIVEGEGVKHRHQDKVILAGTEYTFQFDKSDQKVVEEHLMNALKGIPATFDTSIDGQDYLLNAVPLFNQSAADAAAAAAADADADADAATRLLVVEQNITELKEAEVKAKKAFETEKRLNELKSRFVSMASHEFRTPLSTILSSVSLVEKYQQPEYKENRIKHINRIKTSVGSLTGILDGFLSLDKLQEDKVLNNPMLFNIQELCTEITSELQEVARKGQVINYTHKHDSEICLDKNLLRNVMTNLLSNAIKYSPENETIEVDSKLDKNTLTITISDKGIGIPETDKPHMFERFFRATNSINIIGTGLGLNIVKKYLDLMGGSIDFESEEDKGTTFTVTLPKNTLL